MFFLNEKLTQPLQMVLTEHMISDEKNNSLLPRAYFTLVSLFEGPLSALRFPGVDAAVLRRHQEEVELGAQAVAKAEEAWRLAKADLLAKQQQAVERGERALSYLRVCAADDAVVAEQIAGLSMMAAPVAVHGDGAKRRGRPRKQEAAGLFEVPDPMSADAASVA